MENEYRNIKAHFGGFLFLEVGWSRFGGMRAYVLFFLLLVFSDPCEGQSFKASYEEISYHQESFILFDLIMYYHEDFGSYPEKLNDIVLLFEFDSIDYSGIKKSNIKANLKDPFSGKNFRYILLGDSSFILYSVGADGFDDNEDMLRYYEKFDSFQFRHFDLKSFDGDLLIYTYGRWKNNQ